MRHNSRKRTVVRRKLKHPPCIYLWTRRAVRPAVEDYFERKRRQSDDTEH